MQLLPPFDLAESLSYCGGMKKTEKTVWLLLLAMLAALPGCQCGGARGPAGTATGAAATRPRLDALSDSTLAQFLPAGFALNAYETAALTGSGQSDYLLISRSTARGETAADMPTTVTIVCWTETEGWHELAELNYPPEEELVIRTGKLIGNRDAAVIGTRAGSGGFFNYRVIGCPKARPVELLSRSTLFQGDASIRDGKLYEYTGNAVRVFAWDGARLAEAAGAPARLPDEQATDRIITYRVSRDGAADLPGDTVVLQVGQRLRVRRTGMTPLDCSDRLLYEGGGVLEHRDRFFIARRAGLAFITVVPNGYSDEQYRLPVQVR